MAGSWDDAKDRVIAHFDSKEVSGPCPFCSANDWTFPKRGPYGFLEVSPESEKSPLIGPTYFVTYLLYCNNCGYVLQFMKSVVDSTGEDNPDAEGRS